MRRDISSTRLEHRCHPHRSGGVVGGMGAPALLVITLLLALWSSSWPHLRHRRTSWPHLWHRTCSSPCYPARLSSRVQSLCSPHLRRRSSSSPPWHLRQHRSCSSPHLRRRRTSSISTRYYPARLSSSSPHLRHRSCSSPPWHLRCSLCCSSPWHQHSSRWRSSPPCLRYQLPLSGSAHRTAHLHAHPRRPLRYPRSGRPGSRS